MYNTHTKNGNSSNQQKQMRFPALKKINTIAAIIVVFMVFLLSGCGKTNSKLPLPPLDEKKNDSATVMLTDANLKSLKQHGVLSGVEDYIFLCGTIADISSLIAYNTDIITDLKIQEVNFNMSEVGLYVLPVTVTFDNVELQKFESQKNISFGFPKEFPILIGQTSLSVDVKNEDELSQTTNKTVVSNDTVANVITQNTKDIFSATKDTLQKEQETTEEATTAKTEVVEDANKENKQEETSSENDNRNETIASDNMQTSESYHTHQWTNPIMIREATCMNEGQVQYTCKCGQVMTNTIPRLAHDFSVPITETKWIVDQPAWEESISVNKTVSVSVYTCECGYQCDTYNDWSEHSSLNQNRNIAGHSSYYVQSVTKNIPSEQLVHHDEVGHYESFIIRYKCSMCGGMQ